MNNEDLKGIYSALLIAFDEDGTVNEAGVRAIVRHNLDHMGVDGLYVGGSTGENFMLSTEEKKRIFTIAKDEAGGHAKLIAQVGSLNVREAAELAAFAAGLGYDAVSAVTPFYYRFTFDEIREYYETIVRGLDTRLIIYSIPALTGVNMTVEQFGTLFQNKKIAGVKFTAPDFYLLERLRSAYPDHLLYAGFDEMMLPAAVLGVDGAIGSTFNVNGPRARRLFEAAQAGNLAEAQRLQYETNELISAILANGLYPTLKELLTLSGVPAGFCRRPMASADEKQKQGAREIYDKHLKGAAK